MFVPRSLSAENLSLQSRLEKCKTDYEQRLSIANDQVESLQQELQRYVFFSSKNVDDDMMEMMIITTSLTETITAFSTS